MAQNGNAPYSSFSLILLFQKISHFVINTLSLLFTKFFWILDSLAKFLDTAVDAAKRAGDVGSVQNQIFFHFNFIVFILLFVLELLLCTDNP